MEYSFFALAFDTVHSHVVYAVIRYPAVAFVWMVKTMFLALQTLRRHILLAFYLQLLPENVAENG